MKILYLSQYFPPEMGAPSARAAELSKHWAEMGHDVTVLTGFPNHPTGVVPAEWKQRLRRLYYKETVDGVRVVRTWLWPLPNRKSHERIRNYASFCFSSAISGLFVGKPNVLIATSPQLLVALSGWWLAAWKRVPFVFEVRDLWPESLDAVGAATADSTLHRVLAAIAGFLYRRADRVVVVSPAFKDHLVRYWQMPPEKISVVENGVEIEIFRVDPSAAEIRRRLDIESRFVVCYIGTMGNAHGLDTLVAAAETLQSAMPQALFLLIGEGAEKSQIVRLAAERKLNNIRFLDQQPRELIPAYLSAADVGLVMLKKTELFKTVIPTKMLEYMACERPVIVAVDGQARALVEEAGAGVFVEPENTERLVEATVRLAQHPEMRHQMGVRGRQYIVQNLSRQKTAETYITVLQALLLEGLNTNNSQAG